MKLTIEKLAYGGKGIGKAEGKVVFVKGGLPDDTINVRIIKEKKNYSEAIIEGFIEESPYRIQPNCDVFEVCGGCQWQHLDYKQELEQKGLILAETLERIGSLGHIEIDPLPEVSSAYSYRNRVTLTTWYHQGHWNLGYYQEQSHRVVPITQCPVADGPINSAIERLAAVFDTLTNPTYPFDTIYIASDSTQAYLTFVAPKRGKAAMLTTFIKHLKRHDETKNSALFSNETIFVKEVLGIKHNMSPSLFSQSNDPVNEQMIKSVIELSRAGNNDRVLDLYAGAGNFSLHLANNCGELHAVEINKRAVSLLERSAELNSITNITTHNLDSLQYLKQAEKGGESFDIIILDPPREGAKELIPYIKRLGAERLIYISCNPTTLARDLKALTDQGYRVAVVRPYDMFPQTYHIESVTLLERAT